MNWRRRKLELRAAALINSIEETKREVRELERHIENLTVYLSEVAEKLMMMED
jgi:hypothetical protein